MVKTFKFNSTVTEEEIDETINNFLNQSTVDNFFNIHKVIAMTAYVDIKGNIIYTISYEQEDFDNLR